MTVCYSSKSQASTISAHYQIYNTDFGSITWRTTYKYIEYGSIPLTLFIFKDLTFHNIIHIYKYSIKAHVMEVFIITILKPTLEVFENIETGVIEIDNGPNELCGKLLTLPMPFYHEIVAETSTYKAVIKFAIVPRQAEERFQMFIRMERVFKPTTENKEFNSTVTSHLEVNSLPNQKCISSVGTTYCSLGYTIKEPYYLNITLFNLTYEGIRGEHCETSVVYITDVAYIDDSVSSAEKHSMLIKMPEDYKFCFPQNPGDQGYASNKFPISIVSEQRILYIVLYSYMNIANISVLLNVSASVCQGIIPH